MSCPRCGSGSTDLASAIAIQQLVLGIGAVLKALALAVAFLGWLAWTIAVRLGRLIGLAAPPAGATLEKAVSLRWLDRFPEWFQPIVWGLVASGALGFPFAWWAGPRHPAFAVAMVLFAAGSWWAFFGLLFDAFAAWPEATEEGDAEEDPPHRADPVEARGPARDPGDVERFASVLAEALRTRPASHFRLDRIAAEHGVGDGVCIRAAERLYRRFAGVIVADGVITEDERRRIDRLSSLLGVLPVRASAIESEAKAERYRAAVADVLADGVVTDDEAEMLRGLRDTLGVPEEEVRKAEERMTGTGSPAVRWRRS